MASAVENGRSGRAQRALLNALTWVCCMGFFLGGCGPRTGLYPEGTLGTPEHHVFNGFAFLRMDRLDDAQREFEQALRIDSECSEAHRGMGWVEGRKGDFSAAFASMTHARGIARGNREKALVEVGFMGLYTLQKGPDWVRHVEQSFEAASSIEQDLPEAYFHLGVAYKQAHRYEDAERAFNKVIAIDRSLVSEAKEELASVQEILRAGPRSPSTPK